MCYLSGEGHTVCMYTTSMSLLCLLISKHCCDQVISFFFITDPPEFIGPEVDTSVLEGSNTTLVCASRVDGNPTPTISWMDNNGTTVSDGSGISGSTTLSLTISGVTRYQAGNWTCTAENSPGGTLPNVQHQISLTIVGKCVCANVSISSRWKMQKHLLCNSYFMTASYNG